MKKTLLGFLVVVVLVGGGAFYGGMKYAQSKSPQQFRQANIANSGGLRNGRTGADGNLASGEIIANDGKSITIKLQNGSKIVFYSDTTEISKFVNGTSTDLQVGKTVMVTGGANQDGSITAKSIQIRPAVQNQKP